MQDALPQQAVSDHLLALPKYFSERPEFIECVDSLRAGQPATFDSVWGSSCALIAAALAKSLDQIVVVTTDNRAQDFLIDDLSTFYEGQVNRFPSHLPGDVTATNVDPEYGERLRLIKSIGNRDAGSIIVATIPALLQPTPSRESIFWSCQKNPRRRPVRRGRVRRLVTGTQIPPHDGG